MIRTIAAALCFPVLAFAQQPSPWDTLLGQSQDAEGMGHIDRALSLAEAAWRAVHDAGPDHPQFFDAVRAAAGTFESLGRSVRAEAIYDQSIGAAPAGTALERNLRIAQAAAFDYRGKQVLADAAWTRILYMEAQNTRPGEIYAAELICAAFHKEKLGKLDQAEALYRAALKQPAARRQGWPLPSPAPCGSARVHLPELWDAPAALADFYAAHGRFVEAEQALLSASGDAPPRNRLERLVGLFEEQRKWAQAIALQRQLVAHPAPEAGFRAESDLGKLADLLANAGNVDEASAIRGPLADATEQVNDRAVLPIDEQWLITPGDPLADVRSAIDAGDFDRAFPLVLAAADSASTPIDVAFVGDVWLIAGEYARAGRPDAARSVFEHYLLFMERIFGSGSKEVLNALQNCAAECAATGLTTYGRRLLDHIEPAVLLNAGPQSVDMEGVLKMRSGILEKEGLADEAMRVLHEWLDLRVSLHGESSRDAAAAHREIASRLAGMGRRAEAHAAWLEAIKASRDASGGFGVEHAQVLSAASAYFAGQGEFDLALACDAEASAAVLFESDQRETLQSRLASRDRY